MPNEQQGRNQAQNSREPRGFGERTRGLPGEYAHEQGWGLNEEERKEQAASPRDTDGGTDYNYSAQDFGDEPLNMARVEGDNERAEKAARRALGLEEKENR